jgi:hypothetical protein
MERRLKGPLDAPVLAHHTHFQYLRVQCTSVSVEYCHLHRQGAHVLRDFFVFEQTKLVGQTKVNAVRRVECSRARGIAHDVQSIYGAIIVGELAAAIFSLDALQ